MDTRNGDLIPNAWGMFLQRSHGLSAMDTLVHRHGPEALAPPSKEPWLFSHGYVGVTTPETTTADILQRSHGLSAMDTRRKLFLTGTPIVLQRSHGLSAMDTLRSLPGISAPCTLQRSHDLSAMDTAAVVWDEDAEPVVTSETEQQRTGNFACKLYPEIERSTSVGSSPPIPEKVDRADPA